MNDYKDNIIANKSMDFAVRTAKLYKYLTSEKQEYVMSKQLLRCGTSIGANVFEAVEGMSRSDFHAKMSIALKESNETLYWLMVLRRSEYLTGKEYEAVNTDALEIKKILTKIVKNTDSRI